MIQSVLASEVSPSALASLAVQPFVFFTALMTAGTGAVCVSNPDNLNTVYAIVTVASIGVGGVIIPSSIIAQIACPDELIATITAIVRICLPV
jgi:hypothetical protein